ncbi:MAG: hypothetical protein A2W19_16530 [Spirochaetes bacterium RBG_16_49_21]|nr:MAG: hypothetical protein A2W19_16530 [Spirochaetes bacterium RBG_16_49_21]
MIFNIPYKDERVEGAIAFFASEHKKKTRENLCQTALYKYLAFFDFKSLEETGEPALGLTYQAMEMGPVPKEIYIEKKYTKSTFYFFEEKPFYKEGKQLIAIDIISYPVKKKIYLDYFSEYDLELMNKLIYFFAQSWVTAKIMSDASHAQKDGIKAWIKTWNNKPNGIINMADTFDNLEEKYLKNSASASEEHFYIYQKLHA